MTFEDFLNVTPKVHYIIKAGEDGKFSVATFTADGQRVVFWIDGDKLVRQFAEKLVTDIK